MEDPVPALEQRLRECREGEAQAALLVNLSYLEGGLPQDFVPLVLRANPHVTELDLSSNQLSCLPDNLSDLRELRVLRCKYNVLQGLPTVLASLPRLSVLELAGNQIGDLDASVLKQLTSLRDLDLSGNGLRALPEEVASLPRLERLRLGNNALEHLPAEVGSCLALVRLDVSSNRLLDLPASLTQLQKIQRIDAKSNFLTRVPPCLGHLRALKEFDLRYNRLAKNYHQATEKGLARFLSFLRDEEEIERLAEIERNKPVGLQVGPCMAYKCRAITEDLLPSLGTASEDDYPWVRTGHALCVAGKTVYMFGGSLSKDDGTKTADLFWVCSDRMEWRLQSTKGDKPCARDGHCMVYDPVRERLVVFGGRRQNKRRLNDIYFLDLVTWTWYQPRTDGEVPSPRDQCSALYHDNKMWIFGGRSQTSRLNELHVLDLDAWCWLVPEAHGTVPSPRQGAALAVLDDKLWLHGGTSNFVLDDTFTFDIDSGEWATAPTSGAEVPARHGHAMVAFEGSLFIYGGTDALGAAAPNMYKLKSTAPNRYEWVKTEVALPANKYPSFIFGNDKLIVAQVGHPALKMKVPPMDMAAGRAVLDVVQVVELKDVQEKEAQPEDLIPKNPKLERILHKADAGAKKLPASFTSHSNREQQVIQHIAEFVDRCKQQHPVPFEPPLVLKNEWGKEKIVCSTLRPTSLPQTELHDLGGIVQFVSEYVHFEPLEKPSQPPAHLVSPASVLEWQAGDSFDLATLACSLLLGAGYNACVTIGFTAKHIALNDQTEQECPHLAAAGISQEPPAAVGEASSEDAGSEATPAGGRSAGAVPGGRRSRGAGLVRISEGEEGKSQLLSRPATARSPEEGQPSGPAAASEDLSPATAQSGEELTPQGAGDTVPPAGTGTTLPPLEAKVDQQAAAAQPSEQTLTGGETTGAVSQGPGNTGSCATEGAAQAGEGTSEGGSSGADAAPVTQVEGPTEEPEQQSPPIPPRYLHAFVLVKPGAREVTQPLFVDPATGLQYSPEELPCEGIAFAWNQNNIWANLCSEEQLTPPEDTDWNFGNPNAWEPVLHTAVDVSDSHSVSTEFSGVSSFLRPTQSLPSSSALDWHQQSNHSKNFTPRGATAISAPGTQRPQHKAVQAQAASRVTASPRLANHLGLKDYEAGGSSVSYLAPSSGPEEPNSSPGIQSRLGRLPGLTPGGSEMPATWVPPLVLSRERLDLRCPKGLKRTMYRQCQREIMARFGECARWDGLVERYTLFEDAECTVVECIVELFERRKDRLERRETYPASHLVKDSFGPGATAGLKQSAIVKGERRELSFYAETRADALLRRVEVLGISLEEFYLGRPDRLLSRKIKYGTPDVALLGPPRPSLTRRGSLMAIKRDPSGLGSMGDAGRKSVMLSGSNCVTYPFDKITEKFARDPSLPCDMDVAKRSFELTQDMTFRVTCHYGEDEEGMGRLTRAVRVYGEKGEILENTGAVFPPSADWCKLEHLKLLAARKAAEVAGHAAEDESSEIVLARMRQEQNVYLITGHYDAPRNKVEDSDDEPEGPEEAADYLGPYLPAITGTRGLTAEEAAQVYRKCVQALRDRATERTAVMAARRSAEAADIKRLEGTELQQLSYNEQQRVKEQLSDAKFRASVLERRMQEFQAVLAEKQSQLESKLRADPRLLPAVKARLV